MSKIKGMMTYVGICLVLLIYPLFANVIVRSPSDLKAIFNSIIFYLL